MAKTIYIRIKKAGRRTSIFTLKDELGNVLIENVTKKQLIEGINLTVNDSVKAITVLFGGKECCSESLVVPVTEITNPEIADFQYTETDTGSLWRHLTNPILYNNFYGCVNPYILEYPFAYPYQDEILQNIKDYTKAYLYLPSTTGVFDDTRKVQVDNVYFNKAVLYNDQQSTGILELEAKPVRNMKAYLSYPKYNTESKTIMFAKSDNFYQYNTFWSIVKDKSLPLFTTTCESLSYDKVVNQENMNYTRTVFNKEPLRAKDLKVRHILDNSSTVHLVSQFIIAPSQISYR